MIRVLIVDDHAVVRVGLEQLLGTADDIELVGTAPDGDRAVEAASRTDPDIVLMDLSMPGMDGVEATRRITAGPQGSPGPQVVVLTSFSDHRRIVDALDAGASGYVLKDADPEELLSAIRVAAGGGAPLDPKAARALLDSRRPPASGRALTVREEEVLGLLGEGLPNKAIARRLGITERTVKAHVGSIFQQLGVSDRTQAALWSREHPRSGTG